MTFTVDDAEGRHFVLRRPPMGPLLPSAHDVAREHRLMDALQDSPVPVPRLVGLCQDEAVNERDFYVMHFLDGVVVRDEEVGETLPVEARTRMSHELVNTLVTLHQVDIDQVGLGNLANQSPGFSIGNSARSATPWLTWPECSATGTTPNRPRKRRATRR